MPTRPSTWRLRLFAQSFKRLAHHFVFKAPAGYGPGLVCFFGGAKPPKTAGTNRQAG
ncbi:hypothetical protein MTBLM5_30174 [Magnetospirillum sp. LM-5]|nr:hypothetical protein MTBLM5_30174 [Magnetospirillum sp. LM-5]